MRGTEENELASVVCVHGIGQQLEAAETLQQRWVPALRGGVGLAGGSVEEADVRCAFYGDLFRASGRHLSPSDELVRPNDLTDVETKILYDWWAEAARHDPHVLAPDARTLARTRTGVQAALRTLSGSRFFAGIAQRAMLGDLRQVTRYFDEPELRAAARERVSGVVGDDTRVVVGHSLGSVVAYEAICAHPEWRVHTFVTLGSPLATRNLVFENLDPRPVSPDGGAKLVGVWPGGVKSWVNISDERDVVALAKDLRLAFDRRIENHLVDNGAHAHDVRPYLTSVETGHAIRSGLRHA